MTKEEIRQKAIERGKLFEMMCGVSSDSDSLECACEYKDVDTNCDVVYGYEHGFADGVEEGEKRASGIIIRNVIASLQEIKNGYGTLDEYIIQLYEQVIAQMKGGQNDNT